MSRAFVKELEETPEELPERPVSPHPNLVTTRGFAKIEAEMEALRHELAHAQQQADRNAIVRVSRDLRYWTKRRMSAQVVERPAKPDHVAFATRVTTQRDEHRRDFEIVGEDEADPSHGLIAYCSPMARALLGKRVGDVAELGESEIEILAIAPIAD